MHRLLPLALALSLAACGGDAADEVAIADDPVPGGTAVIGMLVNFEPFNPVTSTAITTDEVGKQMLFTPLVQYDENLEIQPYLARSWELSDTAVTFHLRDDVRWHDGQPVTAEDVRFTFELAKDPATASLIGSAYLGRVESAEVLDPHTIRFRFTEPHAQALDAFWWAPIPRHRLQDVAPGELAQADFGREPVGSGPFRFVSWEPGQQLVLERNPDFPAGLGGPPLLERVVFRIIPEATTMLTELMTGGADLVGYTLLPDQATQIRQAEGVELRSFPSREFAYVGLNNSRPLFDDARERRAITLGVNRPQIIQALLQGYATPAHGMIPPWSPLYTELDPLPYDPESALRLLREAGWQDADGDGVLEQDGRPFRFTLLVNAANSLHQDIATVIQDQLAEIGVAVDVRSLEFQTMLQRHRARDYDAVIANWILDTFRVDPSPLFSCAEARRAQSANRAGYCNPEADRLLERGLAAGDPAEARDIWAEYSRVLRQDQPVVFLYWTEDLAGLGPRPQNVEMDVRSKIVNIDRWWIPRAMQR